MKKVYTIRDVIKQIYKDRIQEEIPYKPSDKKYIGRYQIALSSVQQNLTTEENEEAEELVALWNKQGAPAEMQLK